MQSPLAVFCSVTTHRSIVIGATLSGIVVSMASCVRLPAMESTPSPMMQSHSLWVTRPHLIRSARRLPETPPHRRSSYTPSTRSHLRGCREARRFVRPCVKAGIDQRNAVAEDGAGRRFEHGIVRAAEDQRIEIERQVSTNFRNGGARPFAFDRSGSTSGTSAGAGTSTTSMPADARANRSSVGTCADGCRRCDDADAREAAAIDPRLPPIRSNQPPAREYEAIRSAPLRRRTCCRPSRSHRRPRASSLAKFPPWSSSNSPHRPIAVLASWP